MKLLLATMILLLAACAAPPQPTPQVIYVTPEPTVAPTATPTLEPTPRPTPKPTPVLEVGTPWLGVLAHHSDVLDTVTAELDAFWDSTAGSQAERDAAFTLYGLWSDELTTIAGVDPMPCYADYFDAWTALAESEFHIWDVATDQIIAGVTLDYDALNAGIDRIDATSAELSLVTC